MHGAGHYILWSQKGLALAELKGNAMNCAGRYGSDTARVSASILRTAGVSPANARKISVIGSSLHPAMSMDVDVLLDHTDTALRPGPLFLIKRHGAFLICHAVMLSSGAYGLETVIPTTELILDQDHLHCASVIGRIFGLIWKPLPP